VATQTGYLIGGLVGELIQLSGIGQLLFWAGTAEGFRCSAAPSGDRHDLVATLIADICYAALNPHPPVQG
jgi:hypothetical protein